MDTREGRAWRAAAAALLVGGGVAPLPQPATVGAVTSPAPGGTPPTWSSDVAPLLYAACVDCHRPGGSAPFPLLTYRDAVSRAERIAWATARGYMPPWLPSAGVEEFEGERRLSRRDIEILRQWADAGAPEGDPAAAPPPPSFPSEWSLGEPHVVVEFPELVVPAEGRDVYRNLVVRAPGAKPRWVRTVELDPGNRRVVHHARMLVDTTASSREQARADVAADLEIMHVAGSARNPAGFFVGWTPGTSANPGRDDLAWRVVPGIDLVLQLHLRPTGAPETVSPRLGFYFAPGPPARAPALVLLESRDIDIQPGDSAFVAEDQFQLPVTVDVLAVYPHAHYLGKRLEGWAVLPDGRRRELIRIESWDFDFQDQYRHRRPVRLPAGSLLAMRVTYDNSPANPHNPFDPPRRVVRGLASTDEMAEMGFQVLPVSAGDLATLEQSLDRFYYEAELRWEADEHLARARSLEAGSRLEEALASYRQALLLGDDPYVMAAMARILLRQDDPRAAVLVAQRAAALSGGSDPGVLEVLARAYAGAGELASARDVARRAWEIAERMGRTMLADSLLALRRSLGGRPR